jgi:hypothetical protein
MSGIVGARLRADERGDGKANQMRDEWSVGQAEVDGMIDKIHMRTYNMPQAILPLLDLL